MRLQGVEVSLPVRRGGARRRAPRSRRTSASTSRRRPAPRSGATFRCKTDDGFELESDTLEVLERRGAGVHPGRGALPPRDDLGQRAGPGVPHGGRARPSAPTCASAWRTERDPRRRSRRPARGRRVRSGWSASREVSSPGRAGASCAPERLQLNLTRGPLGRRAGGGDRGRGPRHRGRDGAPGLGRRPRADASGCAAGGSTSCSARRASCRRPWPSTPPRSRSSRGRARRRRSDGSRLRSCVSPSTSRAGSSRCRGCPPTRPTRTRPDTRSSPRSRCRRRARAPGRFGATASPPRSTRRAGRCGGRSSRVTWPSPSRGTRPGRTAPSTRKDRASSP